MGHFPQHSRGVGKDELMRLAERYQTPGSKRPHQLAERWDSCNSVRAGTHCLPDLAIYLDVLIYILSIIKASCWHSALLTRNMLHLGTYLPLDWLGESISSEAGGGK